MATDAPLGIQGSVADVAYTSHYGAGYMISQVGPRIGMITPDGRRS